MSLLNLENANVGGHKCKEYYALDRKVDPALDLGVPAHQVIFHMLLGK